MRAVEPLAVHLYRRYLNGETIADLSEVLSIPEERVSQRIRAAALFCGGESTHGTLITLNAHLLRSVQ